MGEASNLKNLLYKLGIRSAAPPTMEEMMWRMSQAALANYGKPDEIYISGSALQAYLDLVKERK